MRTPEMSLSVISRGGRLRRSRPDQKRRRKEHKQRGCPLPALLSEPLSLSDKKALLTFARESISRKFSTDTVPPARGFSANLQQPRGVFVTLKKRNELRGCIGRIIGDEPLGSSQAPWLGTQHFDDPRFNPVTADELRDIEIEISVLTPLKEVSGPEQIVVGRGRCSARQTGTFGRLPSPGRYRTEMEP